MNLKKIDVADAMGNLKRQGEIEEEVIIGRALEGVYIEQVDSQILAWLELLFEGYEPHQIRQAYVDALKSNPYADVCVTYRDIYWAARRRYQ